MDNYPVRSLKFVDNAVEIGKTIIKKEGEVSVSSSKRIEMHDKKENGEEKVLIIEDSKKATFSLK